MITRFLKIPILTIFLLTTCVSLAQEMSVHHQSLSWMEYESMDEPSRQAQIRSIGREISDCSEKSHCAGLHYQLAISYLSAPAPSRKALGIADMHLKVAAQEGKYTEHALLLHKVLRGWMHATDQHARFAEQVRKLEISLERAKAIDLEKIEEN